MAADTDIYSCFAELTLHEQQNKDFSISIGEVDSAITIIAPHGGRIEPGTSEIARKIAGNVFNFYCFEGLKKENNGRLHITSHNFDEPIALDLVSRSRTVVAVHACTGDQKYVFLGGLNRVLKAIIAEKLESRGIHAMCGHGRFRGSNPENICNRGLTGKGVQLEVTRGLRDDGAQRDAIAQAVRSALFSSCPSTKGFYNDGHRVVFPIQK